MLASIGVSQAAVEAELEAGSRKGGESMAWCSKHGGGVGRHEGWRGRAALLNAADALQRERQRDRSPRRCSDIVEDLRRAAKRLPRGLLGRPSKGGCIIRGPAASPRRGQY